MIRFLMFIGLLSTSPIVGAASLYKPLEAMSVCEYELATAPQQEMILRLRNLASRFHMAAQVLSDEFLTRNSGVPPHDLLALFIRARDEIQSPSDPSQALRFLIQLEEIYQHALTPSRVEQVIQRPYGSKRAMELRYFDDPE